MSEEKKSWDFLKVLTKDEIIEFLKREIFFRAPTKDQVDYFKWEKTSDKLIKEMNAHLADNTGSELAVQIDELAVKLNNERDIKKRHLLFEKRSKLVEQYLKHENKYEYISKRQKENDKIINRLRGRAS